MDDLQRLAARSRDAHNAFLEAVEPHRAALWRYCRRLTGSPWDAEDLVQESLTRALGRLSQVWQPTSPRAYLFRIASNTWIDTMRGAWVEKDRIDAAESRSEFQSVDPTESVADLDYLAATLPPSQAVVVLLVVVFDFWLAEVAQTLDVTANAVKGVLQRARANLRVRRGERETPTPPRRGVLPDGLVGQFIDAFDRRDIDALAALFAVDGVADIVGIGELRGCAMIHDDALSQWAVDPIPRAPKPANSQAKRWCSCSHPAAAVTSGCTASIDTIGGTARYIDRVRTSTRVSCSLKQARRSASTTRRIRD
jgi:RNA polymerase sigma-70 factor (ECF subfamily)